MGTRKQIVVQAITFAGPERVPVLYWNRDREQGDIMVHSLTLGEPSSHQEGPFGWALNEWVYRLESFGRRHNGLPA